MQLVIDIECNALYTPTKIWLVVCKDTASNTHQIFRRVSDDEEERRRLLELLNTPSITYIGHNILGYDIPVLSKLLDWHPKDIHEHCIDTYLISKLSNYDRKEHSLESYGEQFGLPKGDFHDWAKYSQEMEDYCVRDVDIAHRICDCLHHYIQDPHNRRCIQDESYNILVCNDLNRNGFAFDRPKAERLLARVTHELGELDGEIARAFVPHLKLIREVHPVLTQFGTLNKKDFRFTGADLSEYNGGPFCRCVREAFNPSSHKQIIDVLWRAGWKPLDKTKTHTTKNREGSVEDRGLLRYGWKVNEANLSTLPISAPAPAKALARRILLESRRRTLTEWLTLVTDDGRIHGDFLSIGAWTQRMAHQSPNMANIPNSHDTDGKIRLLGAEMRSLFCAPKDRLLVGVDAEGIQLRIFAHLIDDPEFTQALVSGKKEDKSDPHSLNQRILGSVCKTRSAAKRFIYALLLGAGLGKLSEILGCTRDQAESALAKLTERYAGFSKLKRTVIPRDAKRGWFEGLDRRRVLLPGDDEGKRRHLAMSGYLQNGEAVIMKRATQRWQSKLIATGITGWLLVNFVHDEWQTEVPNDLFLAHHIAKVQCAALKEVGEELRLKCPLAGSYGENHDDPATWTIGKNWKVTH